MNCTPLLTNLDIFKSSGSKKSFLFPVLHVKWPPLPSSVRWTRLLIFSTLNTRRQRRRRNKHLPGVSRQEDLLAPRRQQAHYSNPLRPALTFGWRHNRPLLSPSTAGALKFPQRRCRKISLGCQCQLGGATCHLRTSTSLATAKCCPPSKNDLVTFSEPFPPIFFYLDYLISIAIDNKNILLADGQHFWKDIIYRNCVIVTEEAQFLPIS